MSFYPVAFQLLNFGWHLEKHLIENASYVICRNERANKKVLRRQYQENPNNTVICPYKGELDVANTRIRY